MGPRGCFFSISVITLMIWLLSSIQLAPLTKQKSQQLLSSLFSSSFCGEDNSAFSRHELTRRRNRLRVLDRWIYAKRYIKDARILEEERMRYIQNMSLLNQQDRSDGFDNKRKSETLRLSNVIQSRLLLMNNPEDCNHKDSRFLFCARPFFQCGWGSHIHLIMDCLLFSFATSRALVVDQEYYFVWAKYFKPISKCQHLWSRFSEELKRKSIQHYSYASKEHRVVFQCPLKRNSKLGPVSLDAARPPFTLPYDLVDDLIMISPDPTAWFVGQFVSYILRPNEGFQPIIHNIMSNHSKVAIQVRRTDKKGEAKYYDIGKYMDLVQEYFDVQDETKGIKVDRNLFVATDEPRVIEEIRIKYPNVTLVCNDSVIETVASRRNRYTTDGVFGIITDVFKLARADFLVCTHSSNVCRLAYELRMALKPFILNQVQETHSIWRECAQKTQVFQDEVISLDHPWYTFFERFTYIKTFEAMEHQDNNEHKDILAFQKGDIIQSVALTTDRGRNLRTNQSGYLKLSKLREIVSPSVRYPKF